MIKLPDADEDFDKPPNTWLDFVWGLVIFLGVLFFLIGW